MLLDVEADAEADEQDDGGDAPDDAEHGEHAAELVVPQGGDGLAEDLAKWHKGAVLHISYETEDRNVPRV